MVFNSRGWSFRARKVGQTIKNITVHSQHWHLAGPIFQASSTRTVMLQCACTACQLFKAETISKSEVYLHYFMRLTIQTKCTIQHKFADYFHPCKRVPIVGYKNTLEFESEYCAIFCRFLHEKKAVCVSRMEKRRLIPETTLSF